MKGDRITALERKVVIAKLAVRTPPHANLPEHLVLMRLPFITYPRLGRCRQSPLRRPDH